MLEFIILGKVPGTSIYISFTATLLCVLVIVSAYCAYRYKLETLRRAEKEYIENTSL